MAISGRNAEHVNMRRQTMVVDAPITLDQQPDRRQAQRHQSSQSVIVSVVGTASQAVQGEIRNVSKRGTQLHLNQPLGTGSLLRIEYDNNLLLGEVVSCRQEQAGWVVGIRIEHALSGLTALADALRGSW
jgi:PilZ domain-containing protein